MAALTGVREVAESVELGESAQPGESVAPGESAELAASTEPVARDLLGLRVDVPGGRGALPIAGPLRNTNGTLWGGAGLAAAIAVGEQVLGRAVLWATVQYISPLRVGERLDLVVEPGRRGRGMSQAVIRGTVEGRLAVIATGTFGGRGAGPLGEAEVPPDGDGEPRLVAPPAGVQPPEHGAVRPLPTHRPAAAEGMRGRVEQRWALPAPRSDRAEGQQDRPGDGHSALWLRLREPMPVTAVTLAVLADFAPVAVSAALGRATYVSSLDNSIRIARALPAGPVGGWVLIDVRVEAFVRGVAQLAARLFGEDGRLLATAGQSAALRIPSQG